MRLWISLITAVAACQAVAQDTRLDFEWLADAHRQGQTSVVAQAILEDWTRFDWLHGTQTKEPLHFQKGDDMALPDLHEHPEHAAFTTTLFLSLPDPTETAAPLRKIRLVRFAQQLTELRWKNASLKQATLAFLGLELAAARHLKPHYLDLTEKLNLSDLHTETNARERQCQERLLHIAHRLGLEDGPNQLLARLEHLLRIQDAGKRTYLQNLVLQDLESAFLNDWHRWKPEVFTANLQLLPLASDLDTKTWLTFSWAMRLLAQDEANLLIPARIRRAKPDPDTNISPKADFLRTILEHVAQAMNKGDLDQEARGTVATQITQSPNFMRTLTAVPELERTWFRYLETEALLTNQALLENAAAFAKIAPRNGWAWAETAQLHTAANKNADALAHWDSALPFAGEDPLRYSTFQLGRLETLFKLGLQDDAAKTIKAFDKKRLHPDFADRWEALQKQLNIRPRPTAPVA